MYKFTFFTRLFDTLWQIDLFCQDFDQSDTLDFYNRTSGNLCCVACMILIFVILFLKPFVLYWCLQDTWNSRSFIVVSFSSNFDWLRVKCHHNSNSCSIIVFDKTTTCGSLVAKFHPFFISFQLNADWHKKTKELTFVLLC